MTTPQGAKARAEELRGRVVAAIEQASPGAIERTLQILCAFLAEKPESSGPVVEEKR